MISLPSTTPPLQFHWEAQLSLLESEGAGKIYFQYKSRAASTNGRLESEKNKPRKTPLVLEYLEFVSQRAAQPVPFSVGFLR